MIKFLKIKNKNACVDLLDTLIIGWVAFMKYNQVAIRPAHPSRNRLVVFLYLLTQSSSIHSQKREEKVVASSYFIILQAAAAYWPTACDFYIVPHVTCL